MNYYDLKLQINQIFIGLMKGDFIFNGNKKYTEKKQITECHAQNIDILNNQTMISIFKICFLKVSNQ